MVNEFMFLDLFQELFCLLLAFSRFWLYVDFRFATIIECVNEFYKNAN